MNPEPRLLDQHPENVWSLHVMNAISAAVELHLVPGDDLRRVLELIA
jgi:hypothetical protein